MDFLSPDNVQKVVSVILKINFSGQLPAQTIPSFLRIQFFSKANCQQLLDLK